MRCNFYIAANAAGDRSLQLDSRAPGDATGARPNRFFLAYVLVDDVGAATKKAKSLGATVMKDVTPVPDMGSFSIIVDPTGAHLGLWQAKKK